jgi:PAS domain S-box-containing protein
MMLPFEDAPREPDALAYGAHRHEVIVALQLTPDEELIVRPLLEGGEFVLRSVRAPPPVHADLDQWGCVLLSHEPPLVDALTSLASGLGRACASIVIGEGTDARLAAAAFKAGADDFLPRAALDRSTLRAAIIAAIERFQALKALRRRATENAHLAAIVASSSDGIVSLFADGGTVRTWSPGAAALFGYSEEEAIGRTIDDLIIPASKHDERTEIRQTVRTRRRPLIVTAERRHKDGTLIAVEINVSPIFSEHDAIIGFSVVFRDIRERRAAEAAVRLAREQLARREAELTRAQRIARIGSFEVDCGGDTFTNRRSPEYLDIHGLPPEDWNEPHEAWVQRMHPDDRKRSETEFKKAVRDGSSEYETEYRIIRPSDGQTRWIKVLAEIDRNANGDPIRLFGTHIDITDQKKVEEELRASEARLRLAVQSARLGLFEIDWKARRRHWSPELRAMMAVPENLDISNDHDLLRRIIPAEDFDAFRERQRNWFDPAAGADYEDEHEIIRLDGTRCHVLLRGRTLFEETDLGPRPTRTVGLMMDVTDRKRAESQRELLLGELNHRLKNIFATVSSLVTLSARSARSVDDYAAAVRDRVFAFSAVHSLVRDTGPGSTASLLTIAKTIAARGFEDKVHVNGEDFELGTESAVAFGMILNELFTNAIKYGALSSQDGQVVLDWKRTEDTLILTWTERGAPPAKPSDRIGFGTRMIEQNVTSIGGVIDRHWSPDGLRVRIHCPLPRSNTTPR